MGNTWSDKKHNYALFAFYGGVSTLGGLYATSSPNHLPAYLSVAYSVWLGFLLAISGTEAWVKFRAPLLEKPVGLDVGRFVFSALNAIEAGISSSIIAVLFRNNVLWSSSQYSVPALSLAGIVAAQLLYLTPKLELLAKIVAVEEVSEEKLPNAKARKAFEKFKKETVGKQRPPRSVHLAYLALEAAKLYFLIRSALNLGSADS